MVVVENGHDPDHEPVNSESPERIRLEERLDEIPVEEVEPFVLPDFVREMKYSLWTDLSGEQTEFFEAMD